MRKQLHILEHPILHGKPADDFPVHVIWEPGEYAQWSIDGDGTLRIYQATGLYGPNGLGSMVEMQDTVCVLRPGGYLKAWEEELPSPDPEAESAHNRFDHLIPNGPDFVIERAQPGHDGFSEDLPETITGEQVIVTRAVEMSSSHCPTCGSHNPQLHPAVQSEGEVSHICLDAFHAAPPINSGYVEPDEQKTQIIQPVTDKSKRPEYLIDIQTGKHVTVMRNEPKLLDWGTLHQPFVEPKGVTFFSESELDEDTPGKE